MTDFKTRALAALFAWFGRMRPATRQRIGATLGWLTPQLARSRARIVRLNLRLCFPDQPEAVRARWLREHFPPLAQTTVDRGVLWYGPPAVLRALAPTPGPPRLHPLVAPG